MIPLTFLYDEYIDWPKLSEQKNPFEYIFPSPPPTSGVGAIKFQRKNPSGEEEATLTQQNNLVKLNGAKQLLASLWRFQ